MKTHAASILILVGLLLIACSDKKVAGGVDANTNYLQGRLVLSDSSRQVDSLQVDLWKATSTTAKRTAAAAQWEFIASTFTDSRGRYEFMVTKNGDYSVRAKVGDSTLYEREIDFVAEEGADLEADTLPLPFPNKVLLADFENEDTISILTSWFHDASSWGLRVTDSTKVNAHFYGVEECSAGNLCYHLSADTIGTEARYELTTIRNLIRPYTNKCAVLPNAESIQFKAKGSGTVYFGYWQMDSTRNWLNAYYRPTEAQLTNSWNSYTIPIQMNSGDCLHEVFFGLQGEGELWIDDIWIYGVNLLDLIEN